MTTKLSVFNSALVSLGNSPLASTSDNVSARKTLDSVWDDCLAFMIEAGMWKFAARAQALTSGSSQGNSTSAIGLHIQYDLPSDYVRILNISDNNRFRPTLIDWKIEQNQLYCDAAQVYIEYVSNSTGFGYASTNWTPAFTKAMSDELALRAAPLLLAAGAGKIEQLEKKAKRSLFIAKQRDAMQNPEMWPPPGRLVRSRAGWSSVNRMGRTPYY
jgi:hypothetical protein